MKIWRYARSAAKSGSTSSKTRKSACTSQWGRPTTRFSLMCSPRWARRIPVWSLSLSRRYCSVWKGARWGRSWRYRTWRERKINDIWNSNKDHIKWYFSLGNFIFSTLALNYLFNIRTKKFETGFKKTQWVFYLQWCEELSRIMYFNKWHFKSIE